MFQIAKPKPIPLPLLDLAVRLAISMNVKLVCMFSSERLPAADVMFAIRKHSPLDGQCHEVTSWAVYLMQPSCRPGPVGDIV